MSSQPLPVSNPPGAFLYGALPLVALVSSGYSDFPATDPEHAVRLIGHSKLPVGMNGCLSLCLSPVIDRRPVYPASKQSSAVIGSGSHTTLQKDKRYNKRMVHWFPIGAKFIEWCIQLLHSVTLSDYIVITPLFVQYFYYKMTDFHWIIRFLRLSTLFSGSTFYHRLSFSF